MSSASVGSTRRSMKKGVRVQWRASGSRSRLRGSEVIGLRPFAHGRRSRPLRGRCIICRDCLAPSTEDISAIVDRVHRSAVRLLRRRGLFADNGEAPLAEPVVSPDDVALGQCYGGALTGRAAFGPTAGQPSGRLGRLLRSTPPQELDPRCARSHGFNLHARAKRDGAKRSRDGSRRRSGRPRAALPLPDAPPNLARVARAPR